MLPDQKLIVAEKQMLDFDSAQHRYDFNQFAVICGRRIKVTLTVC